MSDIEDAIGEDPEEVGADDTNTPDEEQENEEEEPRNGEQAYSTNATGIQKGATQGKVSRKGKLQLPVEAPAATPALPPGAPRKRGRPKKVDRGPPVPAVTAPRPPAAVSLAPPPSLSQEAAEEVAPLAAPPSPIAEKTMQLGNRWTAALRYLTYYGYGPEHITIRVWRLQRGTFAGGMMEPVSVGSIDGSSVTGGETLSPADHIVMFLTETMHMGRQGPARYDCEFHYKHIPPNRNGTLLCKANITLDDPNALQAQARRAEVFGRQEVTAMPSVAPRLGMGAPAGYAPQLRHPQMPPPPLEPGADPQIAALRADIARMLGQKDLGEEIRMMLAQQFAQLSGVVAAQPTGLAVVPPAAPQISEEDRRYIEEGRFRAMAKALGFVSQDELSSRVAVASASAAARSAGVAAPAAAASAQQAALDPFAGFNALLKGFKQTETLKAEFAQALGLALPGGGEESEEDAEEKAASAAKKIEEENPLGLQPVPMTSFGGASVMIPTKVDSFWTEGIPAFVMANPNVAMAAMEKLSGFLSSGGFQALLARLSGQAPAPVRQVAQQAAAAGLVGRGTHELNGAGAHAAAAALQQVAPAAVVPMPPKPRGPSI